MVDRAMCNGAAIPYFLRSNASGGYVGTARGHAGCAWRQGMESRSRASLGSCRWLP